MAKKATDQKTLDLIKEVNRQKAEIAKIEKPNWKTNCSFPWIEAKPSDAVNIHVETSVKNLISIAAHLQDREAGYKRAAAALGIEDFPEFTWNGFSVTDWTADVKMRIAKIQIWARHAKLSALESRLNAIISPELRAELELEAIASELS